MQSKGPSRVFSNTTVQKHQFFSAQPSSQSNSHIHTYMTTGKTIALTRRTFVGNVMSLLFNMLSRLVITFLPRSKRYLFKIFFKNVYLLFSLSFYFLFSCSVMSDSLRLHGLQHTRLPCPSPSSGACSNSRPLSR